MDCIMYYDNDGYVTGVSCGEQTDNIKIIDTMFGAKVLRYLSDMPEKTGYKTRLKELNYVGGLEYEYTETPMEELSDNELKLMLMDEIIENIQVAAKPRVEKPGFILTPVYSNGMIMWEYVEDENYVPEEGTFMNPIEYEVGMKVYQGLWYTDGENYWECIANGMPESFEDRNYFEIIG